MMSDLPTIVGTKFAQYYYELLCKDAAQVVKYVQSRQGRFLLRAMKPFPLTYAQFCLAACIKTHLLLAGLIGKV